VRTRRVIAYPRAAGKADGDTPAYVRDPCRYSLQDYDWPAAQARLNRFPQFVTEVDGPDIHFIHLRSPHAEAIPLVITHGWPGSVTEFAKVIEPLADPVADGGDAADAFHVVCPSLPGFGFSGKPAGTGLTPGSSGKPSRTDGVRLGIPQAGGSDAHAGPACRQSPAQNCQFGVNLTPSGQTEFRVHISGSEYRR
jgi:pimeloyl-ACP methyl ester carboxylesterase